MSGVDSEEDKQPISSVNGQSGDNDTVSPKKEDLEDHTPSTEGLKGISDTETTGVVLRHSEEARSANEGVNEDETEDSQSPEITNGDHENKKEGESSVVESKPDETPKEVLDNKQVTNGMEAADVENEVVEAGKEAQKAAEQSEPEKSDEAVTAVADEEQNKVKTEPVEVEKTAGEFKEGAVVDEKQPSEESKVAVTGKQGIKYMHMYLCILINKNLISISLKIAGLAW